MDKAMSDLLKPRSIFAFMLYLTFCKLAWTEKIEARFMAEIILIVIAFYYGERSGKKQIKKEG